MESKHTGEKLEKHNRENKLVFTQVSPLISFQLAKSQGILKVEVPRGSLGKWNAINIALKTISLSMYDALQGVNLSIEGTQGLWARSFNRPQNSYFHCMSHGMPRSFDKISEVPKIQVTSDIFIPDMRLFIISWRIKFNKWLLIILYCSL